MTDEELYEALGISHYAEGGQVSDQEIQDFYAANRNDPAAIQAAMQQYGLDQNRVTQLTGYDFNPQQSQQSQQPQISDQQIQDFYGQHKDWTQEQFLGAMKDNNISQKRVFDITGLQFDTDPKAQIHSTTPPSDITGTTAPTPSRWQQYIDANPDLKSAGINTEQAAFNHWNTTGKGEKRTAGLDGATQSNPFSIDASAFHSQVDPLMAKSNFTDYEKQMGGRYSGWEGGNFTPYSDTAARRWSQLDGTPQDVTLKLADGRTWTPSGADNGIVFHPKGEVTQGGWVGGENGGPSQVINDSDYYEVSGDASRLLGKDQAGQKVTVRYKQVGDQMVPMGEPQYQGYKQGWWENVGKPVAGMVGSAVLAYTGVGALAGMTSAGAATGAATGATATGAAATGAAATGAATTATGAAGWLGMSPGLAANATNSFIYNAGRSLATGHNLGDAVTSGFKGAAVVGLGDVFGGVADKIGLPAGQAQILANTGAQLIVNGKEAAINAFVTGETAKGLETVFGKDVWKSLSPETRNAATITASSILQGKDPTPALINIATGAVFSQVIGNKVSDNPLFKSLDKKGQDAVIAIAVDAFTKKDARGDVFNLVMSQVDNEIVAQRKAGNVVDKNASRSDIGKMENDQIVALREAGLMDTTPPTTEKDVNGIVSGDTPNTGEDHSDNMTAVLLSLGYVEDPEMPGMFQTNSGHYVNAQGQFVGFDGEPLSANVRRLEGLPDVFDPYTDAAAGDVKHPNLSRIDIVANRDEQGVDYSHEGNNHLVPTGGDLDTVTVTAPKEQEPLIPLTPITLPEREPVVDVKAPTPETTPAPTTPVKIPTPTPTPTPKPKPATQQQQQTGSSTTDQSIPIALAKLGPKIIFGDHVFNTQDLVTQAIDDGVVTTPEELLKFIKQLDTNDNAVAQKEPEETNPIYAAQGGSIDDLIEYLRS